ncbi:MAG TPA: hypothetical protein DGD08_10995 [Gemmatimonas aurantiaca]|uniref:Uncharacterized protein n=1 Tax=Gemmatimonas aurantiaca TaxID=173480 RepID=A0A3D4V9D4_9BACT|nr:hypothetical protein [Gemmatimonas aurantiaca]
MSARAAIGDSWLVVMTTVLASDTPRFRNSDARLSTSGNSVVSGPRRVVSAEYGITRAPGMRTTSGEFLPSTWMITRRGSLKRSASHSVDTIFSGDGAGD